MNDDPDSCSSTVIEVNPLDPQWAENLPACETLALRAARRALDRAASIEQRGQSCELSISLSNDEAVRTLNRDYRGRDKATNVLSFPNMAPDDQAPGGLYLLGDVILAHETLMKEAREQAKSPSDHLSHLVVHGVLHLLGYDHEDDEEAEVMEGLEIEVMQELGIANPYDAMSQVAKEDEK